jgi:hypothetical protein
MDMSFCSAGCGTEDCERHKVNAPKLNYVRLEWVNLASECPRYSGPIEEDVLAAYKQGEFDE